MSEKNCAELGQRGLTRRPGASRKLLSLKARRRESPNRGEPPLESSFPIEDPAHQSQGIPSPRNSPRQRGASAQKRLRLGDIQPNPGTVFATVVGIVEEAGEVSRTELLDTMRDSSFPHPAAARRADKGWCQGYVAGAIRNGFLAVVAEPPTEARDASASSAEEC